MSSIRFAHQGKKMATSIPRAVPKAAPKAVPNPAPAAEAPPPEKKSRKKFYFMLGALLVTLGAGGGAWYYFDQAKGPAADGTPQPVKAPPPVFLPMESFTVNLQPEGLEQFLQVSFTLQVAAQADVDRIKVYMPQVRSRILLLLSNKKASELLTLEGKKDLSQEIIAQIKQPFYPQGAPLNVSDVFFTSFVIQ
jgi:flagellar FliL protein